MLLWFWEFFKKGRIMDYFKKGVFTLISIIVLNNCGGGNSGVSSNNIAEPISGKLYPTVIEDINSNPNIVEVNLTAQRSKIAYAGFKSVNVYSYNGVIPGPTIEAKVGDRIIVNFKNDLDEPTTVHWHGLELPANMDGSNISQDPVLPGGTFEYSFIVNRAATYWYHPHKRSSVQVELGLHGALIVRDNVEDKKLKLPIDDNEHLLVLDDISVTDTGVIEDEMPITPYKRAVEQLNGREGNILLVNGEVNPTINLKRGVPVRFRVVNVSNARFMRLSIANHQIWRIGGDAGLLSHAVRKKEIGRIFNPEYLSHPDIVPEVISDPNTSLGIILTPGERAEFIFTPRTDLNEIFLDWHDMDRGRHIAILSSSVSTNDAGHGGGGDGKAQSFTIGHDPFDGSFDSVKLATFKLYGSNDSPIYHPPEILRPVSKLDENLVVGNPIKIIFGHSPVDPTTGDVTFFIKMKMNPDFDSVTNPSVPKMLPVPYEKVSNEIADKVKPNETKIINIVNMTGGDHNFHLHGFMFQLLDTQLIDDDKAIQDPVIPAKFTEFKDTILIPRRSGAFGKTRSITRLIVKFDDTDRENQIFADGKVVGIDNLGEKKSGGWIIHCHFLEHSARGMMSYIQVVP